MMKKWTLTLLLGTGIWACDDGARQDIDLGNTNKAQTTPKLSYFDTCEDLEGRFRDNLKEEMRVRLLQAQDFYYGTDVALASGAEESAPSADSASDDGGAANSSSDEREFSGTNNQEEGVDEADFFKNDGQYLYAINGNRLEIMAVPEIGQIEKTGTLEIEGYPSQLLLDGDKAVVVSQVYIYNMPPDADLKEAAGRERDDDDDSGSNNDTSEPSDEDGIAHDSEYYWYPSQTLTKLSVIDLSDRANPTLSREVYVEGNYQTGRKVGQTVRFVAHSYLDIQGLHQWPQLSDRYYSLEYDDPRREVMFREAAVATIALNDVLIDGLGFEDFVPAMYLREGGELSEVSFAAGDCKNFAVPSDGVARGVTSIMTLDLLGDTFSFDADHIVANWSSIYASQDQLVVAEMAQDWWWFWDASDTFEEATNLHVFDISEPGKTTYKHSARVPGTIRNQFSLSEYEGYVRVASTTGQWGRWWLDDPSEPENHIYVLGESDNTFEVVGHVGGIAVGEQIWSSRFVGDEGFLVTFRQVDPLFTIDLSEPEFPKVKGELKIPGVSTYIHPIDDSERLITIGFGGDDNGLDWSTQVSTFDVSDFENPTQDDTYRFGLPEGDGWYASAWSEATYEHKAFQYWDAERLLAVPVSTYRSFWSENEDYYGYEYSSRLELLSIAEDGAVSQYGVIDHSDFYNSDSQSWWSSRDVRRSTFVSEGDETYVYAISDRGISATRLSDMVQTDALELAGNNYDAYGYYGD